jgi:[ribosomal protein S5]-alanine N-acetyltransferase
MGTPGGSAAAGSGDSVTSGCIAFSRSRIERTGQPFVIRWRTVSILRVQCRFATWSDNVYRTLLVLSGGEPSMKRPGEPFNTARLHFRQLDLEDLAVVHRQFSDPDMCRYLSEPPMDLQMARETIEFFRFPERDPFLRYGMFDRETGEFVGTCGYHHLDEALRQVELGYDVWKVHWGRGYATEALLTLIQICFDHLKMDLVYVLIDFRNEASIRVARKFHFVTSDPLRPLDEPNQVCMKLSRDVWERETS